MTFIFELTATDINALNDADLREIVSRLCEAELRERGVSTAAVTSGGAQQAPDGGLDIRVNVTNEQNRAGFVSQFIPRPQCGFQIKKNAMAKAACTREMQDKGQLKPVIIELARSHGAYIIVSGPTNCSDMMLQQRREGMTTAVEKLAEKANIQLDFYGADRVADWARQHLGVVIWARSRLGKPLVGWQPYDRWSTRQDIVVEFLQDDHPCVIDDSSPPTAAGLKQPLSIVAGVNLIREKLRFNAQQTCKVIRIVGLSGVGKTRFAQALFEDKVGDNSLPPSNAIYADLGENITPSATELVTYLLANNQSAYLVLDNCPADVHRSLQQQLHQHSTKSSAKISLLTIEYDISDHQPEQTEVIRLEPSSEATASRLIQQHFTTIGQANADKIATFAAGNARIAIALANQVDPTESLANMADAQLFNRLFEQRKGQDSGLLAAAEVLSLVYSFNIATTTPTPTPTNDELSVLAELIEITRTKLYRYVAELKYRGLLQQRGDWRAILPQAIAHRLSRKALQNIELSAINRLFCQPTQLRLFKSCAHQLGYLHDSQFAVDLVTSWFTPGGPLFDKVLSPEDYLLVLEYVAPVCPDLVLKVIESAPFDPALHSLFGDNNGRIVWLLHQLAYEDEYFDRAVEVILKFVTPNSNLQKSGYEGDLKQLFYLHLSGTMASPTRRQTFLGEYLKNADTSEKLNLAAALFRSAFEASRWSSSTQRIFGARLRSKGWQPTTNAQRLAWYVGFIQLIIPELTSSDQQREKWARRLLVASFEGLWRFVGCVDILEDIVRTHGIGGKWPEMWLAIKRTIHYASTSNEEELDRLKALNTLTAPSDFDSEIEAYVFENVGQHIACMVPENYDEKYQANVEKLVALGCAAVTDLHYFKALVPRLWQSNSTSLFEFGAGLAKGSVDPSASFTLLISQLPPVIDQPSVLIGFIHAVHAAQPDLARQLQQLALAVDQLKPYEVKLLTVTPLDCWAKKQLLTLAYTSETPEQFGILDNMRLRECFTNTELATMLSALNSSTEGTFVSLAILNHHFNRISNIHTQSEPLLTAGRQVLCKLLSLQHVNIGVYQWSSMAVLVDKCVTVTAPIEKVREIIRRLCHRRLSLYENPIEKIITLVTLRFPDLILDTIFNTDDSQQLTAGLIDEIHDHPRACLVNYVAVEPMLKWCQNNQQRIQTIATVVACYGAVNNEEITQNSQQELSHNLQSNAVLSDHIKALLDVAEDKLTIVDIIYKKSERSNQYTFFIDFLEARLKAFSILLSHDAAEVRAMAKEKYMAIETSINNHKADAAKQNKRTEQRFEQ